jgi:uncharacterized cupredoxin-like copper-binding protein
MNRSGLRNATVALALGSALVLMVSAPGLAAAAPPKIKVKLIEFKVKPAISALAAGKIRFAAKNAGSELHEFVVIHGDDPAALPVDADGAVVEEQLPEDAFVGELEDIKVGKTKKKVFKLPAGSYVLFCNIVDEEDSGEIVSHFAEGMYTTIRTS